MAVMPDTAAAEGSEEGQRPSLPGAESPDDTVLIRETADLIPEENHSYGKRDVTVSRARVAVYDEAGVALLTVPMSDVKSARTESLVGGARLELTLKSGQLIPVAEFTSSVAARFSEMARGIEQIAQGEELAIKLTEEKTRCEKCGRLLPEKDGRCPACVRRGKVFARILSYLGPYRGKAALVITASLVIAASSTFLLPFISKALTDLLIDGVPGEAKDPGMRVPLSEGLRLTLLLVGGLLATQFVNSLCIAFKGHNVAFLSGNIAKDLRADIYRALEHLQLSFYDKKQIGAITSRVTQDTDRVWGFLVEGVPYLLTGSLTLVGGLICALLLSWKLALAILIPVPIVAVSGALLWKPMSLLFHKVGQKWGRLHTQLNESMNGIRVVKAFVQEQGEWDKFRQRNEELAQAGMVVDRRWYRFDAAMQFVVGWGPLINWGFGGYLVLKGEMTFGSLMAMQILLWQVYGPLQWFAQVNQWFSRAMAGAERVFEVIDAQPEAYERADATAMPEVKGRVSFENVRFGYDKSNPVLKGINLEVAPGEMVGLVGKSGAGKSTTINLICRFYEADAGSLKIDGVDVKDIKLEDLRRHIGIVLQEPFLFNGTIAENIAYGNPGASFDEIMAAARAACAHDFIVAKPDGYDTAVGEKGGKLSGGEKQRVSIARAILHNPRILILDEATSSVDVETEKKIQQAIGNLVAGRTTFAIAHRLSTLRNADRLVVLEKGQIAEAGTHAELMEKKGEFYKLVETQQQTSKAIAETVAIAAG
ncbi:MAG TPA: ABC transporter ATP-binding protein [Armatimonadaceae bacterium]|nr:ABC transporter ATP-binding protein [Armatimonadaceae bacterium]